MPNFELVIPWGVFFGGIAELVQYKIEIFYFYFLVMGKLYKSRYYFKFL